MSKIYYDENGNPVDVEEIKQTADGKEVVGVKKTKKRGGCFKWGCLTFIVLIVLGACIGLVAEDPNTSGTPSTTEEATVNEGTQQNDEETPEEIADLTITDVREDTTGDWKKAVTSSDVNMPENALAYYNEHMQEGEVHYIISFATNTTTMISDLGDELYIVISEYEDQEEHSAETIGSGMVLGEYNVNKHNDEIEELEIVE